MQITNVMSTNIAKPVKVALIGASGTYGKGILARAEEIGIEAVVVTRSPHKFKNVKATTTVVVAQLAAPDHVVQREAEAHADDELGLSRGEGNRHARLEVVFLRQRHHLLQQRDDTLLALLRRGAQRDVVVAVELRDALGEPHGRADRDVAVEAHQLRGFRRSDEEGVEGAHRHAHQEPRVRGSS